AEDLIQSLRITADCERVHANGFIALMVRTFGHCGLSADDARAAGQIVAYGTLRGSDAHGAVQMPLYVTGLLDGTIKSNPNMVTTSNLPCCAVLDADNGLGLVVGQRAMDKAIELAKTYGMGAVAVRNSSHFGGAGYYADRATFEGLIGFAFTNASPAIAPTGSKEALPGPNPIGVAFPLPHPAPIVPDMATSMVARSRIRFMLALGQKTLPDGWALDADGKPTNDPAAAVKGSVLPIGGPKGYALALMVELLCSALSDGEPGFQVTYENVVKRPSTISQFFFTINPEGFVGRERYGQRASHIAEKMKQAQPIEGAVPRLPGARGFAMHNEARRNGLVMFDNLRHALNLVADLIEKRGEKQ